MIDRASQALSIKMEIEMAVEKERKVTEKERKEKELAIKQMEDEKIEIVTNLLNLKSFSEKQIAEIAKVKVNLSSK